jgi:hypothetical protein
METGLPSFGHGTPFILTKNWREAAKGTRISWILRFFLR